MPFSRRQLSIPSLNDLLGIGCTSNTRTQCIEGTTSSLPDIPVAFVYPDNTNREERRRFINGTCHVGEVLFTCLERSVLTKGFEMK
jgi:hypothetical protein